jgi:DnaJ family protein C protein 19
MLKVFLLVALVAYGWKLLSGRWPWEPKHSPRAQAAAHARRLLGVAPAASREDILEAHRRLVAIVHPDRGGTTDAVHEANEARDTLLAELPLPRA